jgi:ABC-type Fe3+ transport system permease subunit
MGDFSTAIRTALTLIASNDAGLREIVILSLKVSLTASMCALLIGAPLGAALAVYRFRCRGALIVLANALLGLPPSLLDLRFTYFCRAPARWARSAFCSRPQRWLSRSARSGRQLSSRVRLSY